MIISPHTPLQHAVDSAALLHCIFWSGRFSVVDISAAQDKFYETADRCNDFHECPHFCYGRINCYRFFSV